MKKNYLGFIFISISLFSCTIIDTEENVLSNVASEKEKSERLVFETYDAFQKALITISNSELKDPEESIVQFARIPDEFKSLRTRINTQSEIENSNARTLDATGSESSELLSDMVPDLAFSELLNSELEIQVENTVFKITEFGTFFTDFENTDGCFPSSMNLMKMIWKR